MRYTSIEPLLQNMVERGASDLYLTYGFAPTFRVGGQMIPYDSVVASEEEIHHLLGELLEPQQIEEFQQRLEYNTSIGWGRAARFRINVFKQQQHTGVVIRRIQTDIPTLEALGIPPIYRDMVMEKRGLVLVTGQSGMGKTTSLAAMIAYRNDHGSGHIITIEDPIEFVYPHRQCIITQRDVGIDTHSFGAALKNALRQQPDVVLIGEIRDMEAMEHALNFAETGHLVLASLHAGSASQSIERIVNLFPEERRPQVLLSLAFNLKAIFAQRLVRRQNTEGCVLAPEILLNRGHIRRLIEQGKLGEIKEIMERSRDEGMCSFEQSLLDLYLQGAITEDAALAESEQAPNLRLQIKQHETGRKIHVMPPLPLRRNDDTHF